MCVLFFLHEYSVSSAESSGVRSVDSDMNGEQMEMCWATKHDDGQRKWDRIRLHTLNAKTIRIKCERVCAMRILIKLDRPDMVKRNSFQQMLIHPIDFLSLSSSSSFSLLLWRKKDMKIQINLVNLFVLINIEHNMQSGKSTHSIASAILFLSAKKVFPNIFISSKLSEREREHCA